MHDCIRDDVQHWKKQKLSPVVAMSSSALPTPPVSKAKIELPPTMREIYEKYVKERFPTFLDRNDFYLMELANGVYKNTDAMELKKALDKAWAACVRRHGGDATAAMAIFTQKLDARVPVTGVCPSVLSFAILIDGTLLQGQATARSVRRYDHSNPGECSQSTSLARLAQNSSVLRGFRRQQEYEPFREHAAGIQAIHRVSGPVPMAPYGLRAHDIARGVLGCAQGCD